MSQLLAASRDARASSVQRQCRYKYQSRVKVNRGTRCQHSAQSQVAARRRPLCCLSARQHAHLR